MRVSTCGENVISYMDKQKLILPFSILAGCIILGGFFYANQMNKQQSIERQQEIVIRENRRIEEEKGREAEIEKAAKEINLDECLSRARADYHYNWGDACRKNAIRMKESLNDCIQEYRAIGVSTEEWIQAHCHGLYKVNDSPDCSLPSGQADSLNEGLKESKQECYTRYDK